MAARSASQSPRIRACPARRRPRTPAWCTPGHAAGQRGDRLDRRRGWPWRPVRSVRCGGAV